MKTLSSPLWCVLVSLLLATPCIRAAADNPAPVSSTEKLYVAIRYTDPIEFERMRYSSLTQNELILSTLKNTAQTQARAAGYVGEVIVLDEDTVAPNGAAILTLMWGTSRGVTVDLSQGGQKKYLGVVPGGPLAFHPDHALMQRRLDRAMMPDAHRDESLRVGTELELFYALQYVVKHQQSQKRNKRT